MWFALETVVDVCLSSIIMCYGKSSHYSASMCRTKKISVFDKSTPPNAGRMRSILSIAPSSKRMNKPTVKPNIDTTCPVRLHDVDIRCSIAFHDATRREAIELPRSKQPDD